MKIDPHNYKIKMQTLSEELLSVEADRIAGRTHAGIYRYFQTYRE